MTTTNYTINYTINYTLDYMLDRAYSELKQREKKKIVFIQPVIKNYNRKTYIINFKDFCDRINRLPDFVNNFLTKELNCQTSYNLTEIKELKIDTTLKHSIVQTALTTLIKSYVICLNCKSGNTNIKKINRINYLICSDCNSEKSINLI
jgi:translation initiation factor 2 subunit 2